MINLTIEKLCAYAKYHLDATPMDVIFIRNNLMNRYNVLEPYSGNADLSYIEVLKTVTPILSELEDDLITLSESEKEAVMSLISPSPSSVLYKFNELKKTSTRNATLYFYQLMEKNNYVKKDAIDKNIKWIYEGECGNLEVTINLSKPEKSNKDIAKQQNEISTSYPKCNLCIENLGNYGGHGAPARSNIRIIPLKLAGEDWFLQYSPYAYYDEHAIIINQNHVKMGVSDNTIVKLFDFVDQFPEYFVGLNACLPYVGGSILNHEHFQGGLHEMPLMRAKDKYILTGMGNKTKVSVLDWYNTAFKLEGKNRKDIERIVNIIVKGFEQYSDPECDIISHDSDGPHNAEAIITRKVDALYQAYIIIRNNRRTEKYPQGIFHAHPEYHNIKQEGIGLIEAMGLMILPGRLEKELGKISNILSSDLSTIEQILMYDEDLHKHEAFIRSLVRKYGRKNSKDDAKQIIKIEVARVCEKILYNTSLYKNTIHDQLRFMELIKTLGFEVEK